MWHRRLGTEGRIARRRRRAVTTGYPTGRSESSKIGVAADLFFGSRSSRPGSSALRGIVQPAVVGAAFPVEGAVRALSARCVPTLGPPDEVGVLRTQPRPCHPGDWACCRVKEGPWLASLRSGQAAPGVVQARPADLPVAGSVDPVAALKMASASPHLRNEVMAWPCAIHRRLSSTYRRPGTHIRGP